MSRPRHSHLPTRRRAPLPVVLTTAAVLTLGLVGAGVAIDAVEHGASARNASASISGWSAHDPRTALASRISEDRSVAVSRSSERSPLTAAAAGARAVPAVAKRMWTTAPLDLRVQPERRTRTTGTVASGKQVGLTGVTRAGFDQVVVGRTTRWVTASYLSAKKPAPAPTAMGLVAKPCPGTSGVESGLQPGAIRVYEAVCNNFPQITSYGGYAPRGEHASGKAIDIMTSDAALGDRIAAFLQAHAAELNLYDIIWRQHIWTPVRASEGWRSMPSRGSETANHYDHVHVSTN